MVGGSVYRSPLTRLGFEVTVVRSTPQFSTNTEFAKKNEIHMRLRDGEKMKFQRRGKSCKDTMVTMTGDEIIGMILGNNMALLPIAVSAHGRLGSLFRRFLYGDDPLPPPSFVDGRIHAPAADRLARSYKVPRALLQRADDIWRHSEPDQSYSGSYMAMTPSAHFNQKMGLVISSAVSSHLLRAHNRNKQLKPVKCMVDSACSCEGKFDPTEIPFCMDCSPTQCGASICTTVDHR